MSQIRTKEELDELQEKNINKILEERKYREEHGEGPTLENYQNGPMESLDGQIFSFAKNRSKRYKKFRNKHLKKMEVI